MLGTVSVVVLFAIVWRWWRSGRPQSDLDKIPGPTTSPWWSLFKFGNKDHEISHLISTKLVDKYGPLYKLRLLSGTPMLVVSGYENIYKVLVTSGKEFGGRSLLYHLTQAFDNTGIIQSTYPDAKWKLLRRIAHRHLRQFGDGLSRLESVIHFAAEQMLSEFSQVEGVPCNPMQTIEDATMTSITFLITGQRSTAQDPLVVKMRRYDNLARALLPSSTPIGVHLLDAWPWMRFFGNTCWKMIIELREIEREIWTDVMAISDNNPDTESICKVFQEYLQGKDNSETEMSVNDARKASLGLLFAGVVTTSATFYAAINILAHHPQIQKKINDQISTVVEKGRLVSIEDRSKLPYCRAVIFEVLRHQSALPMGVAHRTCTDVELCGYQIPAGTRVLPAIYVLHHQEELWGDPYKFRPERFLDEDGELLHADHPYRKNLMAFGAGLRVCVGEALALARLFLWMTNMIQIYEIKPAPGNDISSSDSRNYRFDGVLSQPSYEVIFKKRT